MEQENSVICGNCVGIMGTFPDACIDLTVTSPPYDNLRKYNGYEFNFEDIAQQLYRVTKPGGVVVWVVGDATINGSETGTSFRQALYFMGLGFNLHDTMIYSKTGVGSSGSNLAYPQAWEYMFVFSVGMPKSINLIRDVKNFNTRKMRKYAKTKSDVNGYRTEMVSKMVQEFTKRDNVWMYDIGFSNCSDKTSHPASFPEYLARDHILSWSNPGDLILDPMCGSGTTLKMAKELGRRFIGIDISREYCDISQKRVNGANVPLFTEA